MKKSKKNKIKKFFVKLAVYVGILVVLLVGTIWGTKYYFYDSDRNVQKTNLEAVSIDGMTLGMNINEVDLTKYTEKEEKVEDCNYNFEELSIKTNSKDEIVYIIANIKKVDFKYGQKEGIDNPKWLTTIQSVLGKKYTNETYKKQIDNSRKIARYIDLDNQIYLGLVYSRYNNEMLNVIMSKSKIKD